MCDVTDVTWWVRFMRVLMRVNLMVDDWRLRRLILALVLCMSVCRRLLSFLRFLVIIVLVLGLILFASLVR